MTEEERQELLADIAAVKNYQKEWRAKMRSDPESVADRAATQKIYNRKNLKQLVAKNKERYTANKLRAIEYMGGVCVDCGGSFHLAAFDFHHIEPREKDVIPKWLKWGWERIEPELDKCVLLCSNCHRVRHYKETGVIEE